MSYCFGEHYSYKGYNEVQKIIVINKTIASIKIHQSGKSVQGLVNIPILGKAFYETIKYDHKTMF